MRLGILVHGTLREAGHSEDAIYEVTVAAAAGAAPHVFESTQD